jgi:galactose-1-phosphate uridylyltransferase
MIHDFITAYRVETGQHFFKDYIRAIRSNIRMDGQTEKEKSLIIYEDDHVMLFVPKAQTSQWEVQLMTLGNIGNILEADKNVRASLDHAMLVCMTMLENMGAKMVTTIEYSSRFDSDDDDQRLLYSFLPKLPESPGAFSEAQLRWINGHYPEDFAAFCRAACQP